MRSAANGPVRAGVTGVGDRLIIVDDKVVLRGWWTFRAGSDVEFAVRGGNGRFD